MIRATGQPGAQPPIEEAFEQRTQWASSEALLWNAHEVTHEHDGDALPAAVVRQEEVFVEHHQLGPVLLHQTSQIEELLQLGIEHCEVDLQEVDGAEMRRERHPCN